MWLINTTSLVLEFVEDPEVCIYAILSHTWGDAEVGFHDMADLKRARKKQGFSKIERTCRLARERDIEYAWVDTCCIDKSSSAELTEAINSMFRWYKQSRICFVFFSDLLSSNNSEISTYLRNCRWFTRGWTLQELIAPTEIEFYDRGWNLIGTNGDDSLNILLSEITGIDLEILYDSAALQSIPVARRMSWAASRQTTRVEDLAYCLFGLFDVNLPLIYGEGKKAFIRLQEAIIRDKNDLSMFAWNSNGDKRKFRGILADSPAEFEVCSKLQDISDPGVLPAQVSITNRGLTIADRLKDGDGESGDLLLSLDCSVPNLDPSSTIVVRLVRTAHGYARHRSGELASIRTSAPTRSDLPALPIPKTIDLAESQVIASKLRHRFSFEFYTGMPFLEFEIQKKPFHLWDQATKSFITDGYQYFTGIVMLTATGNLRKVDTDSDGNFKLKARAIVIFGLRPKYEIDRILRRRQDSVEYWAGLYTDRGRSAGHRALSRILSQEKTHGFEHVAREARKFALTLASFNKDLPTTCKHDAVFSGARQVPLEASEVLQQVESTLSVEVEENSDCTMYKMRLDLKNPF